MGGTKRKATAKKTESKPKKSKIPKVKLGTAPIPREEVVDSELYEVKAVLNQNFNGNRIIYKISWKRYPPSFDTFEPEHRLHCPDLLQSFAKLILYPNYMDVFEVLPHMVENNDHLSFLKNVNALAIIALNFATYGITQFMSSDSIGAKRIFMQALLKHGGEWTMRTIVSCTKEEFNKDMIQYRKQLNFRIQSSEDYPPIAIVYPIFEKFDDITPPPPPIHNLIFDTIYKTEIENETLKQSQTEGFGGASVFANPEFLENINIKTRVNDSRFSHVLEDIKPHKRDPRFFYRLDLRFCTTNMGWALYSSIGISPETPLLQMAGVIVDTAEANKSFWEDGDALAMTSFIKISDTGKCLDRREYYDFSKFIKHSCDPNCSVRYVKTKSRIPKLVIYATRYIPAGEALTLDYYICFADDLDEWFEKIVDPLLDGDNGRVLYLQEENRDHVICNCNSDNCREILYVNRVMGSLNERKPKLYQLKSIAANFPFEGMQLTDDTGLYEIRSGSFFDP